MAAINPISNGANPRAIYNQIVTALSTVLGVTDSLQLYARVAKLEVAVNTHYIDKDGSGNMTLTDVAVGTKTLRDLLGAIIPTTFIGHPSTSANDTLAANTVYLVPIRPHNTITLTGIRLGNWSGAASPVLGAVYDRFGSVLAKSTTPTSIPNQSSKTVSFSSAVILTPDVYWLGMVQQSAYSGYAGAFYPYICRRYSAGSFTVPDSVGNPVSLTRGVGPNIYGVISGGIY